MRLSEQSLIVYQPLQKAGESKPSFAAGLIEKEKHHNLSKKEESWLAGTMLCVYQSHIASSELLIDACL